MGDLGPSTSGTHSVTCRPSGENIEWRPKSVANCKLNKPIAIPESMYVFKQI